MTHHLESTVQTKKPLAHEYKPSMLPGKYLTDVDSPTVGRKQLQESMSVLPTMPATVSVLQ